MPAGKCATSPSAMLVLSQRARKPFGLAELVAVKEDGTHEPGDVCSLCGRARYSADDIISLDTRGFCNDCLRDIMRMPRLDGMPPYWE